MSKDELRATNTTFFVDIESFICLQKKAKLFGEEYSLEDFMSLLSQMSWHHFFSSHYEYCPESYPKGVMINADSFWFDGYNCRFNNAFGKIFLDRFQVNHIQCQACPHGDCDSHTCHEEEWYLAIQNAVEL
jgi:hypothetical protein